MTELLDWEKEHTHQSASVEPIPVREVGKQKQLASDFGSCQVFTVPQAAQGVMPVQLMLRRPKRDEAYVINDNSSSTTYSGSQENYGTATSPGAGAQFCNVTGIPPGLYTVSWTVGLAGTVAAGTDNDNFRLSNVTTSTTYVRSVNPAAVGSYPQNPVTVLLTATTTLSIEAVAAATTGAIYSGQLVVTPVYSQGFGAVQSNGFPIVVSQRPDTLQSATPIGVVIGYGQNLKFVSQQPLYAVAIGGSQIVSVLDQGWQADG
jgi:hypothetical protein